MKKLLAGFLFVLFLHTSSHSQSIHSKLKLEQGQKLELTTQLKSHIAQQAMGQVIDFDVDGQALHSFTVTNATEDNSTLRHRVKEFGFNFDGMGQKRSFHSGNEKDMGGSFGKPVRELLDRSFDMIIDPTGKILMVEPEKIEMQTDERMALIAGMLKDLLEVVKPPAKGTGCLLKLLPDTAITTGSNWTEVLENEKGKFNSTFTVEAITDSTVVVNLSGNSVTSERSQMMGMDVLTNMNNKTTGRIIVDKKTGIVKEKNIHTVSNGNSEVMGGTVPVNAKTTITITVSPVKE